MLGVMGFTKSLLWALFIGNGAVLASPGHEDMEAVDDDDVERLYTGGNMAESTGELGEQRRGSNIACEAEVGGVRMLRRRQQNVGCFSNLSC